MSKPKTIKIGGRIMSELDPKKHGVGGLLPGVLKRRKQDRRAKPGEAFAVVFFPTITGIGPARIGIWDVSTFSQTAAAAKVRFMDRIRLGEKWSSYHKAGHRIRRIKITDLGDA